MLRAWSVLAALSVAGCGGGTGGGAALGSSSALECAPFARQVTGIKLYGDAASWWDQAPGLYEQTRRPVEGGVLVFRRSGRLPAGHVSVVVESVSGREIKVTQANWVHHRITRNEPVVDVSAGNDWSRVRVWWAPSKSLGTTTYPTYGFLAPGGTSGRARPMPELVAEASDP